ncbi:hypothetical protein PAEAM_48520 [Paenibacillus sp. GM1FR]|nr:hypothetical protein PAEAM_48520 [Paenibacillus sp. GM1FR]
MLKQKVPSRSTESKSFTFDNVVSTSCRREGILSFADELAIHRVRLSVGTTSGPMIQYLCNRVKQEHKIMAGGHTVTAKNLLGEQASGLNFLYRLAPVGTIHQIQEVRCSDDRNEYA